LISVEYATYLQSVKKILPPNLEDPKEKWAIGGPHNIGGKEERVINLLSHSQILDNVFVFLQLFLF